MAVLVLAVGDIMFVALHSSASSWVRAVVVAPPVLLRSLLDSRDRLRWFVAADSRSVADAGKLAADWVAGTVGHTIVSGEGQMLPGCVSDQQRSISGRLPNAEKRQRPAIQP